MDFPTTKEMVKNLSDTINPKRKTTILIEQVAYQEALIQALQTEGYPAEGVNPHGQDKQARLRLVSSYVKNGNIFFPRHGSSEMVNQLVNFGVERYDDLVDAFTMMVNQVFVVKDSGLTSQGPMMIKISNIYPSVNLYSKGEDWADVEDRQMLRKCSRSKNNWRRLIG
jgi:predicted phage terminase large subunit-like protein